MPKTTHTRKQDALELLRKVTQGPASLDLEGPFAPKTKIEAEKQYKIWVNSWIIPELIRLIPELSREFKEKNV